MKLYIFVCVFTLFAGTQCRFSCKDSSGQDVDWFIMYKTPQTKGKGFNLDSWEDTIQLDMWQSTGGNSG